MKTERGHKAIRKAMLAREREVFSAIRRENKQGECWRRPILTSLAWSKALDRLIAKRRVVFVRSRNYVGYVVVTK